MSDWEATEMRRVVAIEKGHRIPTRGKNLLLTAEKTFVVAPVWRWKVEIGEFDRKTLFSGIAPTRESAQQDADAAVAKALERGTVQP